jgi:hypothetical protein
MPASHRSKLKSVGGKAFVSLPASHAPAMSRQATVSRHLNDLFKQAIDQADTNIVIKHGKHFTYQGW